MLKGVWLSMSIGVVRRKDEDLGTPTLPVPLFPTMAIL